MPLKLNSTLGGSITLNANTASTFTLDLPAVNGNVITSASPILDTPTFTGTANSTGTIVITNDTGNTLLTVQGDGGGTIVSRRYGTSAFGGAFNLQKARGTVSVPTAVQVGDRAGAINFQAYGGSNYRNVASVRSQVESYDSDSNVSGYLTLDTNLYSTAATERVRITAAGNVAIGTSSPLGLFHSSISGTTNNSYFDAYGGGTNLIFRRANGSLASPTALLADDSIATFGARGYDGTSFTTSAKSFIGINAAENWSNTAQGSYIIFNNTPAGSTTRAEVMRINPSGSVGIGTSSPVTVSNQTSCTVNGTNVGRFDVKVGDVHVAQYLATSTDVQIGSLTNIPVLFYGNSVERARITATGNFGINTNAPATILHVNGTIRYTARPAAGTITAIGYDVNGDLKNSSSSLRYKYDINDYSKGLAEVMQLRPVTFKFNGEERENVGFIAEEIDELGMSEVMLYDEENRPDGVLYPNMVALLTKAIQELKSEVESLKAQIANT